MIFLIQTYEGDVSDLELTFSWDVDNMGKVLYIQTYSVHSTHTLVSTRTGYTDKSEYLTKYVLYTSGQTFGMMIGLGK